MFNRKLANVIYKAIRQHDINVHRIMIAFRADKIDWQQRADKKENEKWRLTHEIMGLIEPKEKDETHRILP